MPHWREVWSRFRAWRWAKTVGIIVVALILLRIAAPWIVLLIVNHALAKPGTYQGHASGISLSLWRGVYVVHGLHLTALREGDQGGRRDPLLDVERIRIALDWGELIRGRVLGRIDITAPLLHLAPPPGERAPEIPAPAPEAEDEGDKEEGGPSSEGPPAERWQDKVEGLASMRLNEVTIERGRVEYTDRDRGFTAHLGEIGGTITGLAAGEGNDSASATFRFTGSTPGGGALNIEGQAKPLAKTPDLEVRAALEHVDLPKLNPITAHFDHLTFASGEFSGYLDFKVADGSIDGLFKPIFRNLDIATFRDKQGGGTKLFWKVVVPVAEFVLENSEKDQHAAEIPITGSVEEPGTDAWTIVITALRNAFIQALVPGFGGGSGADGKDGKGGGKAGGKDGEGGDGA